MFGPNGETVTVPGTFSCTSGLSMFWARSPIIPSDVTLLDITR